MKPVKFLSKVREEEAKENRRDQTKGENRQTRQSREHTQDGT